MCIEKRRTPGLKPQRGDMCIIETSLIVQYKLYLNTITSLGSNLGLYGFLTQILSSSRIVRLALWLSFNAT